MRYITKEEMESLPGYGWIEEALYYSSTPEWEQSHGGGRHNMPLQKADSWQFRLYLIFLGGRAGSHLH